MRETLRYLKNRKAPGENSINTELVNYGCITLEEEITNLFPIIKTSTITLEWKTSIVVPIFKTNGRNYHTIIEELLY